jgi:hypothetical protein
MPHESNARIARQLRALADSIERCSQARTMGAKSFGGEPRCVTISFGPGGDHLAEFPQPGLALFIGDADFVKRADLLFD